MFKVVLNQKIKNLNFTFTSSNRCNHYSFFLFPSDLSKFGYKFRFPVSSALRFCIEWYDNRFFLVVHSYSRNSKGNLVSDALYSYYNRINKEFTLKELIDRVLPFICDIEKN